MICTTCGLLNPADDVDQTCVRCGATVAVEAAPGACRVNGRGRLRAVASVTGAEAIIVRLDDDARDEFWAEIEIRRELLMDLLRQMESHQ